MDSPLIPVIDLASLSLEEQASRVKDALSSVGFLSVTGTSITSDTVRSAFELSRRFFDRPMEEKMLGRTDEHGRGYTQLGLQSLSPGLTDHKESYSYGKHSLLSEQPSSPVMEEAREQLDAFLRDCHDVSEHLMRLFARALEVPDEHFSRAHTFGKNTGLSLIHYPPKEGARDKVDIRAGAHKDWGTLTLLFQEDDGPPGLEVFLPVPSSQASAWQPAPVIPGSILVNVGLGLELWSGGAYKATLHRVVFPQSQVGHRYSMAYFVQADDEVRFDRILAGGEIEEGEQAPTSLELFTRKLNESMGRSVVPVSV